jgi:hypothetical protein
MHGKPGPIEVKTDQTGIPVEDASMYWRISG